jgi:hypothetical protein
MEEGSEQSFYTVVIKLTTQKRNVEVRVHRVPGNERKMNGGVANFLTTKTASTPSKCKPRAEPSNVTKQGPKPDVDDDDEAAAADGAPSPSPVLPSPVVPVVSSEDDARDANRAASSL